MTVKDSIAHFLLSQKPVSDILSKVTEKKMLFGSEPALTQNGSKDARKFEVKIFEFEPFFTRGRKIMVKLKNVG